MSKVPGKSSEELIKESEKFHQECVDSIEQYKKAFTPKQKLIDKVFAWFMIIVVLVIVMLCLEQR